jgi:hypothetical protein
MTKTEVWAKLKLLNGGGWRRDNPRGVVLLRLTASHHPETNAATKLSSSEVDRISS